MLMGMSTIYCVFVR